MNKRIIKCFFAISLYCALFVIISLVWQGLELLLYGALRPNAVDSIVGLAFSFCLYKLVSRQLWRKNDKKGE